MKERPILFSAPMVRALLAGTKTQTRRRVKPQPPMLQHAATFTSFSIGGHDYRCPYGQPGDRLWVQEEHTVIRGGFYICTVRYEADGEVAKCELTDRELALFRARKYPFAQCRARFMYRSFSRLVLELTGVRVERLNDITEAGAKAEGVFFKDYGRQCGHHGRWQPVGDCPAPEHTHPQLPGWQWRETASHTECLDTARGAFANLWNHVNGSGSWDANPWVWVLGFKRVEVRS